LRGAPERAHRTTPLSARPIGITAFGYWLAGCFALRLLAFGVVSGPDDSGVRFERLAVCCLGRLIASGAADR
jgi:hypothetical protein